MKHVDWTPSLIGTDIQVASDVIARSVFGQRVKDNFFADQAGSNVTITKNALGSIIAATSGGSGDSDQTILPGQDFGKHFTIPVFPEDANTLNAARALIPHNPRIPEVQAGSNITIVQNARGPVISSSGGGGGTFGTVVADFGTASPTPSAVTVAVVDAGVGAASNIVLSVNPGTGRDLDEMELGPVVVAAGDIVAGVGFNIIAVAADETAHGTYNVQYTRN